MRPTGAASAKLAWAFLPLCAAPAGPALAALDYDDAGVVAVNLTAKPADVPGPYVFYENSAITASCAYGYKNTGSKNALPWMDIQLYVVSDKGVLLVFHSEKSCLKSNCTAEALLAGVGVGKKTVGCKIVQQGTNHLNDANPNNNKAEVSTPA